MADLDYTAIDNARKNYDAYSKYAHPTYNSDSWFAGDQAEAFREALRRRGMGEDVGLTPAQQQYQDQAKAGRAVLNSQLASSHSLNPAQVARMQNRQTAVSKQGDISFMDELAKKGQLSAQGAYGDYGASAVGADTAQQNLTQQHALELINQQRQIQEAKDNAGKTGDGMWDTGVDIGKGLVSFFSDEDVKKNIKKASGKEMGEFLDALSAKHFNYKQDSVKDGDKRHTGITTQDLRKSVVGSRMVGRGKDASGVEHDTVDAKEALGSALAALGSINERLRTLEGKE